MTLQVGGQLAHGLGKLRFAEGNNKYTYQAFLMRSSTVYDDWAESIRYRLWVRFVEENYLDSCQQLSVDLS